MLKFRTVFVLGAGASIPFGFQSGAAMLRAAKELTRTQLRTAINGALHHDQEVLLLDAIANTQEESLDSMLETQPVHIQAAGKRLIARRILTAESEVAAAPTRDWFSYLFSRMTEGIAARGAEGLEEFFYQNNIVFVTYNYDRLVEHKLMAGLSARYGANEGNWSDVTGRVIHLHGSVGDIHPSARMVPWGANFKNGNSLDVNINAVLSWSEQSIKIVHEPKPDADEFKRARGVLSQAERVFFLGFGFGRTNVDRLDFGCIPRQAVVRATQYQMTNAEGILYIQQPLQRAAVVNYAGSPPDWDCLALLQENITALVARY